MDDGRIKIVSVQGRDERETWCARTKTDMLIKRYWWMASSRVRQGIWQILTGSCEWGLCMATNPPGRETLDHVQEERFGEETGRRGNMG